MRTFLVKALKSAKPKFAILKYHLQFVLYVMTLIVKMNTIVIQLQVFAINGNVSLQKTVLILLKSAVQGINVCSKLAL